MAPNQIAIALTYLEQYRIAVILSIKLDENQVLSVIGANEEGITLEYIWANGFWV
jgi:hypothetical protein